MHSDTFNPPLLSSQGRNPIWERPARKSRPQRSLSPSCSSRPSGRWRTSSMSLHWSSSSSSGHMLLEKRMGSSTCWRRTSSMRKSTPKTKEACLIRVCRSYSAKRLRWKRWGRTTGDRAAENVMWSCRTICLGTQRSDWRADCSVTDTSARQLDGELVFRQQCVPSQQPVGASAPFHFHFKGRLHRWSSAVTCLETDCPNSWSDLDFWLISRWSGQNIFIGSVLFGCVWLYFNSLVLLSFVCKTVTFSVVKKTSPCLTTTTNLSRFLV